MLSTMIGRPLVAASVLFCATGNVVHTGSQDGGLLDDDECLAAANSEACALSALQRRGMAVKAEADAELAEAANEAEVVARAAAEAARTKAELENTRTLAENWQKHMAEVIKARRGGGEAAGNANMNPYLNPYTNPYTSGAWHGGGMVDSLGGADQIAIMRAREQDWRIGPIIYQVFVDRFVPPTKSLDELKQIHPPPQTVHAWDEPVFTGGQDKETKYYAAELAYWGGDLKGVQSKLDYVQSLADVLYLQPIFEAFSCHKYDTSDYHKIDEAYGTYEDFDALQSDLHDRGMHLVLDGVFNHMGIRSKLFKDAMKDPNSPYRHWYFIDPVAYGELGYKAWQGGGTLAELRLEDPYLQSYLWNSSTSVIGDWLKRGADGFRLDVGTEIGREFLWSLTRAAHRHKPGSMVVGEVSAYPRWWTEAMDGILSFWMGWVISGVVTGKMGGVFAGMQIQQLITESSMEQVLRSWIVVSNHDLPRLSAKYPDVQLRQFALTLQFVLPGAVCIYYGEELGMPGDGDPYNREPMKWDWANETNEIYNYTRTLITMRKTHRALRIGDFHTLNSFSLLAFLRRTDRIDEIVIVLANPTSNPVEEQLVVPVEDLLEYTLFRDVLSGSEARIHGGTIKVSIPPKTTRVFTMVDEKGPNGDQYKRIFGHWHSFTDVNAMFSLGNGVGELV